MSASFPHTAKLVKRKRVVVAGQTPPPIGGQALMIEQALIQFREADLFAVEHLSFRFTPSAGATRQANVGKLVEGLRVLARFFALRLRGRIDVVLYPIGGPQLVPTVRDLLLLPPIFLLSRQVIIHFHAGGIAETLDQLPGPIPPLAKSVYRKASAAIVMTEFGRKDPEFLGIRKIEVVPHNFEDAFDAALVHRAQSDVPRVLYLGHFFAEKGTPQLLRAVGGLITQGVRLHLDLVGECLPPYSEEELRRSISQLSLTNHVTLHGVLSDRLKWERYAEADLFVFPSVARESFGVVMAEAMMWSLPVLACDWRGNREVLGNPPEQLLFPPEPDLTSQLQRALANVIAQRGRWSEWGKRNRHVFLERYDAAHHKGRLAETIRKLIDA
jgi:glycosyltransferase involved in cell wall biosynthesis